MPAAGITGAAGDIGRALAESFLADGLSVYYLPLVMVAVVVGLVYTSFRPPRLLRW